MDWPGDATGDDLPGAEPTADEAAADRPAGPAAAGDNPLRTHPDLQALGRRLRIEMDETLRAEQYAARVSARRRSTMRDRFLLAEDRGERLAIDAVGGSAASGRVIGVGADHVVLAAADGRCWIALSHIVTVRSPAP